MYVCVKRYAFLLLEKYTTLGCCPRERSPKFPIPAIQVLESVTSELDTPVTVEDRSN